MKSIFTLIFLLCCHFSSLLQAQQTAPYFGNALHFDGVNDYVEINGLGALMTNIDSFTIELTVQLDINKQQSGGHRSLFAINKSIAGGENELLIVMGNHGASRGKTLIFDDNGIGTGAFEISGNTSIGDGDCHHIAYVKAGDSAKLYVDGLWQGSHHVGYSIDTTKRFSLGQDWDRAFSSDFTNGSFSEVRVWGVARSVSDLIKYRSAINLKPQKGLLAYYKFQEGVPGHDNSPFTRIFDYSGNNVLATLRNFALKGNESNWTFDACLKKLPCTYYDTNYISVQDTLIIDVKLNHNGQINTAQFHVYPNPAKSFLIIDAPSLSVNKGYELRVLNAIGQTVYSSSIKQSQIKLDISKWGGAGMYVLELVDSGKGVHFSKKIILQ
jgi:hypothetical protein